MSKKIAVVTGASSGIGLLSTIELARAGFQVVGSMRDLGRREYLEKAAADAGVSGSMDVRRLDVTEFGTIAALVAGVVRDYGRIDVLLNNAGFAMAGFAEDLKLEEIRTQFETNFFGNVAMTQAVLPVMRQQKSGHVIMMSSIAGLCAPLAISSYAASKFALEGWSESLRLELNALGIKVVLVEPGSYETDIWSRNTRLGEKTLDGTSPNQERGARMKERVQSVKKRNPIEVARLVVRIAQNPNPKLRYVVGTDAKIQLALKRVLPWKQYEKVIAYFLKVD